MFLLRCAFWLTVVYVAMFVGLPWQTNSRVSASAAPIAVPQLVAPAGSAAVGEAVAGMVQLCSGHAAACAKDAAGLTALVQAAIAYQPSFDVGATHALRHQAVDAVSEVAAPMPAPAPRHRGRLTGHS